MSEEAPAAPTEKLAQAKPGAPAPGDVEAPESGTPRQGSRRHHSSERGLQRVPESALRQGKFGRLFQDLPSYDPGRALIDQLVDEFMREVPDGENDPGLDNPFIPAGYTYFGQFLDHDITFDPVSSLDRQSDPDALHNFRTPRLDLDSVYGTGPNDQPYLYDDDDPAVLLFTERNVNGEPDLQRNDQQRALIGDPRNDENVIVSQLHLLFIRLHNRLLADIRAGKFQEHLWNRSPEGQFREAQRLTRWHYQYVVATDFLRRICGADTLESLLQGDGGRLRLDPQQPGDRRRYTPRNTPYMPVEFSVGAYRYGHSQPRGTYDLNKDTTGINLFVEDPAANPFKHLGGFRTLIQRWSIDWSLFLETTVDKTPQLSRRIDRGMVSSLFFLGPKPANGSREELRARQLPHRNLLRGVQLGLPSGEAVARDLGATPIGQAATDIKDEAPLWYYVLAEAEQQTREHEGEPVTGAHLGPVGGRIVAEVVLGLLHADKFSFLRADPGWTPAIEKLPHTERFGLADLAAYADGDH